MTIPDSNGTPRLTRPQPQREGPMRGALHAFRPTPARGTACEPQRSVERAVELAYRVYDEYLRWGKASAAQHTNANDWSMRMRNEPLDPRSMNANLTTQWMQMWEQAFKMWLGPFSQVVAGAAPGLTQFMPHLPGFVGPHATVPAAPSAPLQLEIDTAHHVRVTLELTRQVHGTLKATLVREEGEGRLALEFDGKRPRISIPRDLVRGTYLGVVRDAAGNNVGVVTVVAVA